MNMSGAEFSELLTFLAVARHNSFRQAALERSVGSSAISYSVRNLEERVGVRLFNRTTRKVSLTEAGERFLEDLRPAFEQIAGAFEGLNAFRGTPFGTVRLNVPNSIAPFVLQDVMGPLLQENPGLQLDIAATDKLVDVVEQGFDAGIRFGERLSQDMIAVRIKSGLRFAVVGSPFYFKDRVAPQTPFDLKNHACIQYRFPSGARFNWEFERGGEELSVEVSGPLTLDDQELMVEAALQGCGLAYVWDRRVLQHLQTGALIRCLEDWCVSDNSLFLYYPSRRHVSGGLRALIDKLKA